VGQNYAGIGRHFGSIARRKKPCCKCGKSGKYGVWGSYYCKSCFIKYLGKDPDKIAEKGGKGHSGMLPFKTDEEYQRALSQAYFIPSSHQKPHLIQIPKGDKLFASLYLTHYPESKGIVGRSINYLVIWKERVAGIIGGSSPPYSVIAVDEYFGITKENRNDMLLGFLNNEVFRLIVNEKNLATMTLSVFRKTIKKDYIKKYETDLFVFLNIVCRTTAHRGNL